MNDELQGIIQALEELSEDSSVPTNVRTKLSRILTSLRDPAIEDTSIKINKVLDELEEISSDTNLPSYTRTDIWNITSMLEELAYNHAPV
ncbi:MAG: UPF0147 family protein [Candidatus Woesearchaeota archaeon]